MYVRWAGQLSGSSSRPACKTRARQTAGGGAGDYAEAADDQLARKECASSSTGQPGEAFCLSCDAVALSPTSDVVGSETGAQEG